MDVISALGDALRTAFDMFWEILWPLVLGFALSGAIQAVVSHRAMAKLLGRDSPGSVSLATAFGVASSSCSYAAIALARSIFRKGASFTNAMVFELASTNLVIELGIILIVLLGWQFAAAEYAGGIAMVVLLALIFRATLTKQLVEEARTRAERGASGRMEGHAGMDMSVEGGGSFWARLTSARGVTATSHYFGMDWASIWQDFFLTSHPTWAKIEGPLVGPLVAIVSFVCSVGNVPLAAVLWKGGISFGGVVSFIFADLIVLPVLDIYRKYYGWKVMLYILATFYVTMAVAGYVIEIVFGALGIIPTDRSVAKITEGVTFNYTAVLNIIFVIIAAVLVWRFLRTGGPAMLRMMSGPVDHNAVDHGAMAGMDHSGHAGGDDE